MEGKVSVTKASLKAQSELAKKKEKDKRSKSRKRKDLCFEGIPGVQRITLSEDTQKYIGCVVGETVTAENPWVSVKKELVEDQLEINEETEFLPYKERFLAYTNQDIFFGYIPDESRDYDEFYMCTTVEAQETVGTIIEKMKRAQQKRLNNSIAKTIKAWKSQGSELEMEELLKGNNRTLLQVEMESDYPIMNAKVHFKQRLALDTRDGYAEIISTRQKFNIVHKRRIDAQVQASASVIEKEVQTKSAYPTNSYTEYENFIEKSVRDSIPQKPVSITSEMRGTLEKMYDHLRVNGNINLYANDYASLINQEKQTAVPETSYCKEYMSFTDIAFCKNKMISSASWHPMWTGTVAVAYVDEAPSTLSKGARSTDEVYEAVHGIHPVLLWSFVDALNAKLFLETHREVRVLSFCPYDENILIGGLCNGQIIVWDIRNKLQYVEYEEILSNDQARYRALMHSLMQWMKNIHDLKIVRSTAVSALEFCHIGPVTAIQWLPPHWEISNTGKLKNIYGREEASLQFMTSSVDGTILFWDLASKPKFTAGGFKPIRRIKRLPKKPDTLTVDISPYKRLNRVFTPTFKINVKLTSEGDRLIPLSSLYIPTPKIEYVEVEPDPKRKFDITDRIFYKPDLTDNQFVMEPQFVATTIEGDIIGGRWEGFDFNSGEVVNSEDCKVYRRDKYHDGPILNIEAGHDPDVLLTVGGNILAIWDVNYCGRPIIWRRSIQKYTHAIFNRFRKSMFMLTRTDGNLEVWQLLHQSHQFNYEQTISGQYLTGMCMHTINIKQNIMGICDYNGSFRIFYLPASFQKESEEENEEFHTLFQREVARKTSIASWQEKWRQKNAEYIASKEEEVIRKQQEKTEKEQAEKKRLEEEIAREQKEAALLAVKNLKPPPGQYLEWARERFDRREEDRMQAELLLKKNLNKELLEKEHAPIKKFEEDKQRRHNKQIEIHARAYKIFNEKVAMLFPDALKKKPPPPINPYDMHASPEEEDVIMDEYGDSEKRMEEYIKAHPFVYTFDWRAIMKAGKLRRKMFDALAHSVTHPNRHAEYKSQRMEKLRAEKGIKGPRKQDSEGGSSYEIDENEDFEGDNEDEGDIEEEGEDEDEANSRMLELSDF